MQTARWCRGGAWSRGLTCAEPPGRSSCLGREVALLRGLCRVPGRLARSATACRLATSSLSLARSSSSWLLWLWKAWHLRPQGSLLILQLLG